MRLMLKRSSLAIAASLSAVPAAVLAQSPIGFTVGAAVSSVRVNSQSGVLVDHLSGVMAGGEGRLSLWKASLDLRYFEGSADSSGEGDGKDIVEGEAMLGFSPLHWLTVKLGPHIRSMISDVGTQRWFFWEIRLRGEATLGIPVLKGYLEGWNVISNNLDVPEPMDRGQGLEGGLKLESAGRPLWARVGYRMDHSRMGSGARTETMEQLVATVGLSFGR